MNGDSWNVLGKHTREGESPVNEIEIQPTESRVLRDTRNPVGSRGDHPPSLNTPQWPIEKQYCEGKVKRTPGGEWKRTWNLMLTNSQRETDGVLFVERSGELQLLARLNTEEVWSRRETKSEEGEKVSDSRPETGWPIHVQVEGTVKGFGGPNTHLLKKVVMRCG